MSETPMPLLPSENLRVTPPHGVVEHDMGQNRFGLTRMYHGKLDVKRPNSESQPGQVDGTLLVYEPNRLGAEVARQGLSAVDINRIGELALDIARNQQLSVYVDNVLKSTTQATIDLRPIVSFDLNESNEEVDAKARELITDETGISPSALKEKQSEIEEKRRKLEEEAEKLGVVIIKKGFVGGNMLSRRPNEE